jgi:hypothetical protein
MPWPPPSAAIAIAWRPFENAGEPYLGAVARVDRDAVALPGGHRRLLDLAARLLPARPLEARS